MAGTRPERWARRFRVLPLRAADGVLEVATADPLNLDCERAIAFATGRTVHFALASPLTLARELDGAYRDAPPPAARVDVQHLTADVETARSQLTVPAVSGSPTRLSESHRRS